MSELVERLRAACDFYPHPKIAWPYRILHEAADEIESLRAQLASARKVLEASQGFLLNAKVDLETGAPKRTAIRTIEGGLSMIKTALTDEESK